MDLPDDGALVTMREFAGLHGVSRVTVDMWRRTGRLTGCTLGSNAWLIPWQARPVDRRVVVRVGRWRAELRSGRVFTVPLVGLADATTVLGVARRSSAYRRAQAYSWHDADERCRGPIDPIVALITPLGARVDAESI